jgi:ArsR family transcriptional regulator
MGSTIVAASMSQETNVEGRNTVLKDVQAFLKLIADPNRLRIILLLTQGERCVCDIESGLGLRQNLISHHLSVLRRAGLIMDRRDGRWVYYRLKPEALNQNVRSLCGVLDTSRAEQRAHPCGQDVDP